MFYNQTMEDFKLSYLPEQGEGIDSGSKKKIKIYLSYYKEDIEEAKALARRILEKNDAIIYFRDYELYPEVDYEDLLRLISHLQVVVFCITDKYLSSPNNESYEKEFEYIKENNIPYLPIINSEELVNEYTKKFGDIQYLNINQNDVTAIGVDKKLQDYFNLYIIKDEEYLLAKSAFKYKIFLSYRKKDRVYALDIIDVIHSDENCRNIAIWYDEFLVTGDDFQRSINEKLGESAALLLVVTPNLINEENYVKTVEYKYAYDHQMLVIPVIGKETDVEELKRQFIGIPELIKKENASNKVDGSIEREKSELDANANFALGIAYLFGVEVEINRKIALEYLLRAAVLNHYNALNFLAKIYRTGNGVVKNFDKAQDYEEKLLTLLRKRLNKECFNYEASLYYSHYINKLGLQSASMNDIKKLEKETEKVFLELKQFKTIEEKWRGPYINDQIQLFELYYTFLNLGFEKKELFVLDDYERLVEEIKPYNEAIYYHAYLTYLLVKNFDGVDLSNNAREVIDSFFLFFEQYYQKYPHECLEEIVKACNHIGINLSINNSLIVEALERLISYYEKSPYKNEFKNNIINLKVSTFVKKRYTKNFFNDDKIIEEMMDLIGQYRKSSKNDVNLLQSYYALADIVKRKEQLEWVVSRALDEIKVIDESVFLANPQILAIRDYFIFRHIRYFYKGSEEGRVNKIFNFYCEVKKLGDKQTALNILIDYLLPYFHKTKNQIDLDHYYQEALTFIEEGTKTELRAVDLSVFALYSSEGKINTVQEQFNYYINVIVPKHFKDEEEQHLMIINKIVDNIFRIEPNSDIEKECIIVLYDLLFKYIKATGIDVSEHPYLIAPVFDAAAKCIDLDTSPEAVKTNLLACQNTFARYARSLTEIDDNVIAATNSYLFITFVSFKYFIKSGTISKLILTAFKESMQYTYKKIPTNQFDQFHRHLYAVLAYCLDVFFDDHEGFVQLTKGTTTFFELCTIPILFTEIITSTEVLSLQEKADFLYGCSDCLCQVVDEDLEVQAFADILYSASISLLQNKQYELLTEFHLAAVSYIPRTPDYSFVLNRVYGLLFFDYLIQQNHEETDKWYLAFTYTKDVVITEKSGNVISRALIGLQHEYVQHVHGDDKYKVVKCNFDLYELYSKSDSVDFPESIYKMIISDLDAITEVDKENNRRTYPWYLLKETFDNLDEKYKKHPHPGYLVARMQYLNTMINDLLYEEEYKYEQIINAYSAFVEVVGSLEAGEFYSERYLDTLAIVLLAAVEKNVSEDYIQGWYHFGMNYYIAHLGDRNKYESYFFFFMINRLGFGDEFSHALEITQDPNGLDKHDDIVNSYLKIIKIFTNNKGYQAVVIYGKELEDELKTYKDEINQELLNKAFFILYHTLAKTYEILKDDERAYDYQELAKGFDGSKYDV